MRVSLISQKIIASSTGGLIFKIPDSVRSFINNSNLSEQFPTIKRPVSWSPKLISLNCLKWQELLFQFWERKLRRHQKQPGSPHRHPDVDHQPGGDPDPDHGDRGRHPAVPVLLLQTLGGGGGRGTSLQPLWTNYGGRDFHGYHLMINVFSNTFSHFIY